MLRVRELIARLCVDKEGCYQLQPFCASVTSELYLSDPTQSRTNKDAFKELFDSDPDYVVACHDNGDVSLQMLIPLCLEEICRFKESVFVTI